jgi:hypothetical protein
VTETAQFICTDAWTGATLEITIITEVATEIVTTTAVVEMDEATGIETFIQGIEIFVVVVVGAAVVCALRGTNNKDAVW